MFSGFLTILGLLGLTRDAVDNVKSQNKIARAGNPIFVNCKDSDDVIRRKCVNNVAHTKNSKFYIPLTPDELETIRQWVRDGKHYSNAVDKCYREQTGEPLSIVGMSDKEKAKQKYMRMLKLERDKKMYPNKWEEYARNGLLLAPSEEEIAEAKADPTNTFADKYKVDLHG